MADVETTTFEDPAQAISQGKRHLLVRDYNMAVTVLAQGCSMLAGKHGEIADELGEPYLLYGRALLCLSREEAGVLGSGVPGNEEAEEEGEGAEEEGEGDAEGEGEEGEEEEEEEKESSEKEKDDEAKAEEKKDQDDAKEKSEKVTTENKPEEKKKDDNEKIRAPGQSASSESATSNGEQLANGKPALNGSASASGSQSNGVSQQNAEEVEDAESVDNEDDEDGNSNLQLAWEILELAKLILVKRGEAGWKMLAETHRLLGEVAMESGNQPGALTDLNACLDLLRKIEPADPRSMAETHYQLGLAHSLGNEFDASIEQFKEATSLLETRIKELQAITEPPKTDDPFYTVEGEIKELQELLPEIQDKIADMRDFKQQACKLVIEGIKSKVAGSCSNGAGPSGASSSGASSAASSAASAPTETEKPVTNISHLVRKKRKNEDDTADTTSPCKKPTPEKAV